MAGPNLELFKFGMYLFFPLAVMVHFGAPDWYHQNVVPIRDQFWPKPDSLYKPPRDADGVKKALDEMKATRLAKREQRLLQHQQQQREEVLSTTTTTPPLQAAQASTQTQSRVADMVREKQSQRLV